MVRIHDIRELCRRDIFIVEMYNDLLIIMPKALTTNPIEHNSILSDAFSHVVCLFLLVVSLLTPALLGKYHGVWPGLTSFLFP